MKALSRVLGVLALSAAGASYAADVGRVLLAAGDAVAVRGSQTVKLALGSPVQERDVLRTGAASSLQVRFIDESITSLRENSELRIDEFRFAGNEDGTERAFFRLLKGGLRAVTGLVGRTNRQNYALSSITSTIGIRGTDFVVRLCQQDCPLTERTAADEGATAPAGAPAPGMAPDGLYGRVLGLSHGTNRIDVKNERDQKSFGINENFFVSDAKSIIQQLLAPPGLLSDAARPRRTAKPAGGTGSELMAAGGAAQDSRTAAQGAADVITAIIIVAPPICSICAPPPPLVTGTPTIAGLAAYESPFSPNTPSGGGGFFTRDNALTNPAGADLLVPQTLVGFALPPGFSADPTPNAITITASNSGTVIDETSTNNLGAHAGRWLSGSIADEEGVTTFNSTRQFHYLYGPLTPPDVIAAKTGAFSMFMAFGTTPTNQLGQSGSFSTSLSVNFTARTATFGPSSFSFPSDSWGFAGGTTPIQIAPGRGAFFRQEVPGSCSGATCSTSTPAVLSQTGIFMGPLGDHVGAAFQARTVSGPSASAQTAKIFRCSGSC